MSIDNQLETIQTASDKKVVKLFKSLNKQLVTKLNVEDVSVMKQILMVELLHKNNLLETYTD